MAHKHKAHKDKRDGKAKKKKPLANKPSRNESVQKERRKPQDKTVPRAGSTEASVPAAQMASIEGERHAAAPWTLEVGEPAYDTRAHALIERLESDLQEHMERSKPARYQHSLAVAKTAEQMALRYGVDPLLARIAGILHDWDKVLTPAEQIALASRMGINLGVEPRLVCPLLHGLTAARRLPDLYPELPGGVWQAIARHTIGHANMTPLDMVIFVADGIEPHRSDVPAIREVRDMVSRGLPLDDVYWTSFYHGVSYVIDTERYLYPGTLDIYNQLALRRRNNNR